MIITKNDDDNRLVNTMLITMLHLPKQVTSGNIFGTPKIYSINCI